MSREAGTDGGGLPGHRGARAVPSHHIGVERFTKRILNLIDGDIFRNACLAEAQFVALIQAERPRHGDQHGRRLVIEGFGVRRAGGVFAEPATPQATVVMVADDPAIAAIGEMLLNFFKGAAHERGADGLFDEQGTVVGQMGAFIALHILTRQQDGVFTQGDLRQGNGVGILIDQFSNWLQDIQGFGTAKTVFKHHFCHRIFGVDAIGPRATLGAQWLIPQLGVVNKEVGRVNAKSVHPAIEPELSTTQDGLNDCGVVPIELGLTPQKSGRGNTARAAVPKPRQSRR